LSRFLECIHDTFGRGLYNLYNGFEVLRLWPGSVWSPWNDGRAPQVANLESRFVESLDESSRTQRGRSLFLSHSACACAGRRANDG
jgi:hypothetical protein